MGIKAIEIAKNIAKKNSLPVMMHIGESRARKKNDKLDSFSRDAIKMLEENDILSHFLTWEAGGMIHKNGSIYQELIDAKNRGVALDSCHGLNHFSTSIAKVAIKNDILPTVISTDLTTLSIPFVQSLPIVMSKFLNLGLSLNEIILMTTKRPAMLLKKDKFYGSIKSGMAANLFVFEIIEGSFQFNDGNSKETLVGDKMIEPRIVIHNGNTYPAFSNYHLLDKS
jgi:predicted amidohydrolase